MATLSDKQIQELVELIDANQFTLDKVKDTLGIKDAPPPILMSAAASGMPPPPPPSGMMPAPPAPAMGGIGASASSGMKTTVKVQSLTKIRQAITGLGPARADFQNALPGHARGIESSVEETFVATMTAMKVAELSAELRGPWVQGVILAVKAAKFKQKNKDTEIDRLQNHQLPALIGELEQSEEYEFIYEINRRVRNFSSGDGGYDQLNDWLSDALRKRTEKARQAKLMSSPQIQETVQEYRRMQQEFLRLHDDLSEAILDEASEITVDNYKEDARHKRMEEILSVRDHVDNQLKKIITQGRKLNEKAEKVKTENDRLLRIIKEQMDTVEQNILRLQGEEANIPPEDKESLLAARVNIELNEQKKRLLERERRDLLEKLETFKENDTRVRHDSKNVAYIPVEKLLTEDALRECHTELQEIKAEQALYAEAFMPGKGINHPAVSKEGKLRIQVISEQTQRKTISREQSTTVGLIVAAGKNRYLVLDNEAEIPLSGYLPRLGLNVVAEKDARVRIQEATSGASGIAMTSQAVYLGAFTPSQLKRIAYFCGPQVSMNFDPSSPEHLTELDLVLSAAISNSSITMGDVMLVALGYRTRPVDFLSQFLNNQQEGYTFSPEFAKNSLFSEALVINHKDGASEEHKSRVYGHKEDLNPTLEQQMPQAAVQNAPKQDGARLAKANSFDHPKEFDALMRETVQAMETLRQKQVTLLEVKDNDENDPDYLASLKTLSSIEGNMPTEHPQAELCRFLALNPDVYHEDDKLMLANLFTNVVLRLDDAKSLVSDVNKEISAIEGKIRAAIEAKEKLKQQERAEEQFKMRLQEIRDSIKETMLGAKDAEETPPMTEMLDKMAKLEYESKHGKLPSAEETITQQQTHVQQQMAMVTQTLKVEQAQGTSESVDRVKRELQALQTRYGELEQEMIALKQLTAAPKAAASAPDSERVRELEAQNLRLQEQLSKAKSGVPEPENFGAACRQFNDVKAVIEWAKRTNFGPINESQAVSELAQGIRGAARISAVNKITSAVGEYNRSIKKPVTRKGF